MKLEVRRFEYGPTYTIGKLFVDDEYLCYTLEDVVRPEGAEKVYGQTAIPAGEYPVIISKSPKFKKQLPELLNVPGFSGVRIHSGNTSLDTDGCILVGKTWNGGNYIYSSRVAFDELFIRLLTNRGHITIKITDTKVIK